MRIFGSDRISGLMQRLGMEEGVPIEHGMVTNAIERAQKQVEAQNFALRKHLLEYDDVMNKQRENIYALRRELLEGKIQLDGRSGSGRHPRVPDDAGRGLLDSVLDYALRRVGRAGRLGPRSVEGKRPARSSASKPKNSPRSTKAT